MDMPPIEEILQVVREEDDAARGLHRLTRLCRRESPGLLWDRFDAVDPKNDVEAAREWLRRARKSADFPRPAQGLYLGLLDLDDGPGPHVEIAATSDRDPSSTDLEWAWRCEWRGDPHRIAGLGEMRRVYGQGKWKRHFEIADYALPLGYGGLVLAEALADLAAGPPFLAAWGFHDGDLFPLGRADGRGFARIATIAPEAPDRPTLRLWTGPD